MTRYFIDCRDVPSESGCSIAISADTENELVEAAAQHAVAVHGHADDDSLREALRDGVRAGSPA